MSSGLRVAITCAAALAWLLYLAHTADCPAGKVAVRGVLAFTCVQP